MRKQSCQEIFHQGQRLRLHHPLQSGQYKLEECRDRLRRCYVEIGRIRRYLTGKGSPYALQHCTTEDKHLWLKDLPGHVAHRLGYEVVPGLLALGADGADPTAIMNVHPRIENDCLALVGCLESARTSIRRSIGVEYEQMKQDGSMLEPLVERAIDITDHALIVLS
jgi:hypothetical protein